MALRMEFWAWLGFGLLTFLVAWSYWTRRVGQMWRDRSAMVRAGYDYMVHAGVAGAPVGGIACVLGAIASAVYPVMWLAALFALLMLAMIGVMFWFAQVSVPRWYGPLWFRRLIARRRSIEWREKQRKRVVERKPNLLRWSEADVRVWAAPVPAYDELTPFDGVVVHE